MSDAARFLGFAFANADFLFEVDGQGTVAFATGASKDVVEGVAVGKPAGRMFTMADAAKFTTLTHSLPKGSRAGPFKLKLACGTDVLVSMFRLSENGNQISCTLSKSSGRNPAIDAKSGLSSRSGFLAAAATITGENDALALVDMPELPKMVAGMSEEDSTKLFASIGTALNKAGAKAAGRLSPSSFGVIAEAVGGTAKLAQKIRQAVKESEAGRLAIEETLVSLKGKDISDAQRDLVVRYVVDKFTNGRWDGPAASDAATQFNQMMEETQSKLRRLTETVADGSFAMSFQPVVSLKTGVTVHYEALARFRDGQTQDVVNMVEALGISDAFDLAVAVKVLAVAEARAAHAQNIAFNVSGNTICSPANFGLLAGLLTRKRALAPMLLVEISDSAAIDSLPDAAKAVAAMRAMGYRVGLDDFGAGAASLSYLHAIPVDFVKFDGGLIANLGKSARDDQLLSGLVRLCGELGVTTVAEHIENQAQADAAKAMGFDLAQGFHLGRDMAEIPKPQAAPAKRKGFVTSWS